MTELIIEPVLEKFHPIKLLDVMANEAVIELDALSAFEEDNAYDALVTDPSNTLAVPAYEADVAVNALVARMALLDVTAFEAVRTYTLPASNVADEEI